MHRDQSVDSLVDVVVAMNGTWRDSRRIVRKTYRRRVIDGQIGRVDTATCDVDPVRWHDWKRKDEVMGQD